MTVVEITAKHKTTYGEFENSKFSSKCKRPYNKAHTTQYNEHNTFKGKYEILFYYFKICNVIDIYDLISESF